MSATSRGKVVPAIVCGGLSLFLAGYCQILGLILGGMAVAFAGSARREALRAGQAPESGIVGAQILGVLGLVLNVISLLLAVYVFSNPEMFRQLFESFMSR
jgi:hypothetical protein